MIKPPKQRFKDTDNRGWWAELTATERWAEVTDLALIEFLQQMPRPGAEFSSESYAGQIEGAKRFLAVLSSFADYPPTKQPAPNN